MSDKTERDSWKSWLVLVGVIVTPILVATAPLLLPLGAVPLFVPGAYWRWPLQWWHVLLAALPVVIILLVSDVITRLLVRLLFGAPSIWTFLTRHLVEFSLLFCLYWALLQPAYAAFVATILAFVLSQLCSRLLDYFDTPEDTDRPPSPPAT